MQIWAPKHEPQEFQTLALESTTTANKNVSIQIASVILS